MDGNWNLKPHGTFPRKPERGAYILREPKGIPDVLLFSEEKNEECTLKAAAILSVQGITARIVLVSDIDLFYKQDDAYIQSIFGEEVPVRVGLFEHGKDCMLKAVCLPEDSDANKLAQCAVHALRA